MHKGYKVSLIVAVCCIALGFLIWTCGLVFGGGNAIYSIVRDINIRPWDLNINNNGIMIGGPGGIVVNNDGVSIGGPSGIIVNDDGVSIGSNNVSYDGGAYETKDLNMEKITGIDTWVVDANIEFFTAKTYGVEIKYYDSKYPIGYDIKNGKLTIRQQNKRKAWFNWGWGNWNIKNSSVKIYLPEDADLSTIKITSTSGDIKLQTPFSCDNINVNSISGNIILADIQATEGDFDSASGDIALSGFISKSMKANAISGNVSITGGKLGSCRIETASGDIICMGEFSGDIQVNSISGNVKLDLSLNDNIKDSKLGSCRIETTSGDISCIGEFLGDIRMNSISGNVNLGLSLAEDDYNYDIRSLSGSIKIGDTHIERKYSRDNHALNSINIETTSGDTNISFR